MKEKYEAKFLLQLLFSHGIRLCLCSYYRHCFPFVSVAATNSNNIYQFSYFRPLVGPESRVLLRYTTVHLPPSRTCISLGPSQLIQFEAWARHYSGMQLQLLRCKQTWCLFWFRTFNLFQPWFTGKLKTEDLVSNYPRGPKNSGGQRKAIIFNWSQRWLNKLDLNVETWDCQGPMVSIIRMTKKGL